MEKHYGHIIMGGTFDRFHAGHEVFVNKALEAGKRITIGITTEPLYRHKLLAATIESYETRRRAVESFIRNRQGTLGNITFIPLTDVYGVSHDDESVEAIVVTSATVAGANAINRKRQDMGKKALNVIVVPLLKGSDGEAISSERIRYGDIDRMGNNYYRHLAGRKIFIMPEALRAALREPLGGVFKGGPDEEETVVKEAIKTIGKRNPPMVFAIGDIVTRSLQNEGYRPPVTVVDLRSRREALPNGYPQAGNSPGNMVCPNAAGTIGHRAVECLKLARDRYMNDSESSRIVVEGEEDLLALPAILIAPLKSFVLYGQYNLGVIAVEVTEETKSRVMKLLEKFT